MPSRDAILALQAAMNAEVLGQPLVIERMVIGLLADGHLLIEGLPGLAKTRAVKAMAKHLKADFNRIQFTPDLLPSDVTGTDIYYSEGGKGEFNFQPGPVFGNLVLADEINRAPAKVQAALLEAMEERQVTVGQTTDPAARSLHGPGHPEPDRAGRHLPPARGADRPLPDEGNGRLPRAPGRDRRSSASSAPKSSRARRDAERGRRRTPATRPISLDDVFAARREIATLHVAEAIETYIIDLVNATRHPDKYSPDLAKQIDLGASPRAGLALDRCGRAYAWLKGADFVSPGDIQAIAPDVLRHRIALSYEAQAPAEAPTPSSPT